MEEEERMEYEERVEEGGVGRANSQAYMQVR